MNNKIQVSSHLAPEYNLAHAIAQQACHDYVMYSVRIRKGIRRGKGCRKNNSWEHIDHELGKRECLDFFFSDWFGVLCSLDPAELVKGLDKKVDEKMRRR